MNGVLRLRKVLGLTQREFSKAMYVDMRRIERWESGDEIPLGCFTLGKLARLGSQCNMTLRQVLIKGEKHAIQ